MSQKKLLILGGLRYQIPVIRAAQKFGYYVITCDNVPDNYAHSFSDEYRNVSIKDKEAVLQLADSSHVDGIMSFAVDPGVTTAAYVAEKLGLPSCGSYESVEILQNKDKFRNFLKNNGFNVPRFNGFERLEDALKEIRDYRWPLIVKPVDSAGSKGVTRVDSVDQLKEAFELALNKSFSRKVIIEEFIEKEGLSSDSDCFSVDGTLVFSSFSSQYFDGDAANPFTPSAYRWPASMLSKHQTTLSEDIQRLLKLLGMRTSIYNIESRVGIDGKPYIMEVSPRGGGNRIAEMLNHVTGVNLIDAAVLAAMGEHVDIKSLSGSKSESIVELILHSNKSGLFKRLDLTDELKSSVREVDLWVKPGDYIETFNGANDTIGTIVFSSQDAADVQKYVDSIQLIVG